MKKIHFNIHKTKVVLKVLKEHSTIQELTQNLRLVCNKSIHGNENFSLNTETVFYKGVKSTKTAAKEKEEYLLKTI